MRKKLSYIILTIAMTMSLVTPVSAQTNNSNNNVQYEGTMLKKYDLITGETSLVSMNDRISGINNGSRQNTNAYVPSTMKGGISPNVIIGDDERTQVTNTSSTPYYGIAQLEAVYTDSTAANGTGFMVSENVMLTVGHMCMSEKSNAPISSMTVNLGRNGSTIPTTAYVTSYYVCANYNYFGDDVKDDYAILILNSNVGNTTGWLGVGYNSDSFFTNNNFTITGYPGDKTFATMWKSSGKMSSCSTYELSYKIDMMGGQSGAPIYTYLSSSGYVAYGINAAETSSMNYGRRMTQELFDWLYDNGFIH